MDAAALNHDLMQVLRGATSVSHKRLETGLDLLRAPLSCERFRAVLERFYGFHAVFDPAVSTQLPFAATRGKTEFLRRDLAALGVSAVDDLRRCTAAADLCDTPQHALGALYVVEGSTLGGQYISQAMAGTDWLPEGGLTFFNPYGPMTGARWKEFKAFARDAAPPSQWQAVERGANRTFDLIHDWVTPGLPA